MPKFDLAVFDKHLPSPFAMQEISNVSVRPGVSTVVIQFNTKFPTVPIIEVSRVDRIAQQVPNPVMAIFPIFSGLQQVHAVEFRDLDPFTHYRFDIKATGSNEGFGQGVATHFGDFFTATRAGSIVFDNLQIIQRADRDMYFNIEIYNGGGNYDILSRFISGHKFLDRGSYGPQPFPSVDLGFAPDQLRFAITGYDEDGSLFGFGGFAHGAGPETLPPQTWPDGNSYFDSDQAILTGIIYTYELGQYATPRPQTIQVVLSSINKRFAYDITGRIVYQVKDHPETIRRNRIAQEVTRPKNDWTVAAIGQAIGILGKHGHTHVFALAPGDSVYRQVLGARPAAPVWKSIGEKISGPLTALQSDTGAIDLFATASGDERLHGYLSNPEDVNAMPVWKSLGSGVQSALFPVRSSDGELHVFGLDEEGAVRHVTVGANARSDWNSLGGKFKGTLSLVANGDRIEVFVSDPDRGIFHKTWSPSSSSTDTWSHLDGFRGPISSMRLDDGRIVVVGFENGNAKVSRTWTSGKGWESEWFGIDVSQPGQAEPSSLVPALSDLDCVATVN